MLNNSLSKVSNIPDKVNGKLDIKPEFSDRNLGNLKRPGERLREYREKYLGMTLEDIEAHYGVNASTWSYAETEGKTLSSKILDPLSKIPPPEGKQAPSMVWLVAGIEPMTIPAAGWGQLSEEQQRDAVQRAIDRREGGGGPRIDGPTMEEAARLVESQILKGRPVSESLRWELIAVVSSELADLRALGKGGEILERIRGWMVVVKAGLPE